MRSDVRLYCHAHRFAPVGFLLVVAGLLVIAAGSTIVSVPWLSGSQTINVATLCALAWPVACTLIFRNELSRLEAFGARAWAWADAGVLCLSLIHI